MKKSDKKRVVIYASILFGLLIAFAVGAKTLSSKIVEILGNISISSVIPFKSAGCGSNPVLYGIDSVDSSFGISPDLFKGAVREAEGIWEKGSGDDLFIYSEDPEVEINLVFDDRQAETNRLKTLLGSIETNQGKFDALKEEYDSLAAEMAPIEASYNAAKSEYESLVDGLNSTISLYNVRKKQYEDDVAYWNNRGGAPKKEYNQLAKEYDDIRILFDQISPRSADAEAALKDLQAKADAYNLEAGKINTIAGILNRLAAELNNDAFIYNKFQGERDEFVTGLYSSSDGEEKIDVYQFYDYRDLVIILAHEMGHALGVGHGTDPNSIMYPKVGDQPLELSFEDILMLKEACSKK